MALKATLNESAVTFPLIDGKRHVTPVSLVQIEPTHDVAIKRAVGDDAVLANARPDRNACAFPVVGTRDSAREESVVSMLITTGSG